jgi:hypothetical protein
LVDIAHHKRTKILISKGGKQMFSEAALDILALPVGIPPAVGN